MLRDPGIVPRLKSSLGSGSVPLNLPADLAS